MIKLIKAEQTYGIRKEVLRKGIDLPYKFNGDLDDNAYHIGYFDSSNTIKGVLTLIEKPLNMGIYNAKVQLRGMAVHPDLQGSGVGSELLNWSFNYLKTLGYDALWCNARVKAYKFYERNGFIHLNREFDIQQIGLHDIMYKKL